MRAQASPSSPPQTLTAPVSGSIHLPHPSVHMCLLFCCPYWPGPLTVSTSSLDSFLPSPVQMAPLSAQSVVTGRVIVT